MPSEEEEVARVRSVGNSLEEQLTTLEPRLAVVLGAIASAVVEVADLLRVGDTREAGSANAHGDQQLEVDVAADALIFRKLSESGAVETATSEETSELVPMGGHGFSVAFDPVDGSSIIPANFAVGSIFGIWPGGQLLGRSGRDQVAACYAVYGPRTILVLSRPKLEAAGEQIVQEFVLIPATAASGGLAQWELRRAAISLGVKKIFAPANLRAVADNVAYMRLVQHWLVDKYTLRYTGGMVPDVHHILAKGGGVFCNPASAEARPKLRLLYEAAPIAFVVESAGGASQDGRGSILDKAIDALDARTVISLGSPQLVEMTKQALANA